MWRALACFLDFMDEWVYLQGNLEEKTSGGGCPGRDGEWRSWRVEVTQRSREAVCRAGKRTRVPCPGTKPLLCSVPLRPGGVCAPESRWASSVTWGDADLGRLRMWLSDIASFPAQRQKCSQWPFPPSPLSTKSSGPLSTLQNRDEVDRWGVLESWAQGCLALLHASLCG